MIDDVEDVVMHGSQVSSSLVSSIKLYSINELNIHCEVYNIDNYTKYYLAKSGDTDVFYEYNLHYGWNKLSHDLLTMLSKTKVEEITLHLSKSVLLNAAGNRMKSNDNESKEGQYKSISPRC